MTPLVTSKAAEAAKLIVFCFLLFVIICAVGGLLRVLSGWGGGSLPPHTSQSSHPSQSGAVSNTAVPDTLIPRFYTKLEEQRIMRGEGVYLGPIDGIDGPLTQAARVKHNRLYCDQQAIKEQEK